MVGRQHSGTHSQYDDNDDDEENIHAMVPSVGSFFVLHFAAHTNTHAATKPKSNKHPRERIHIERMRSLCPARDRRVCIFMHVEIRVRYIAVTIRPNCPPTVSRIRCVCIVICTRPHAHTHTCLHACLITPDQPGRSRKSFD